MKPFRLVILNEFFYPDFFGGTGKVLSDLARRLQDDHDIEVSAIASARAYRNNDETLGEIEDWDGITIRRIPASKSRVSDLGKRLKSDLELTKSTAQALSKMPCDGVLVTTSPPLMPLAAWWMKKTKGIPYWYIIYDLEPDRAVVVGVAEKGGWKTKLLGWWQKKWMHSAEKVVVIGRCMKDHVQKVYSVPDDRIVVIATGEDDATVKPLPKQSAFRAGLPEDAFVVLYSGNFGRYHDFTPVLDAAEELQGDPRFRFMMVGGGHKKEWVEEEAKRRELKNFEVRAFVPPEDFPCLLASADVCLVTLEDQMEGLCVPSKFYSFLASGRPVLALMRAHGEVARVVSEEGVGKVVDPAVKGAMAKAVKELASDPEELAKMSDKARKVLEEKYSSRKIAAQFAELFTMGRRG
jgi:glycosyltransferase involved in cell wall biosynthesis